MAIIRGSFIQPHLSPVSCISNVPKLNSVKYLEASQTPYLQNKAIDFIQKMVPIYCIDFLAKLRSFKVICLLKQVKKKNK